MPSTAPLTSLTGTELGHTAPGNTTEREGSRKVEEKGGLICKRGISVHSTQNRACLPHASGCMRYGEQIVFQAISAKFDTRFT